ncbi:bifunctional diguanylate cyclase/phosphodiesterase [Marinobacter qingdaonensis]|uniref:EAL domain-containing protein n=1 Tax=Marinobacter qingdaonensis TaxID=3108486 RepID=A0ABU5NVJ4_9GAMM|nr:EAL domain-containing protein [Marinobacter sp. ASW11-75]MEA1079830.1 EAL domain-containing protein [Marinobacter sp. ASW11-75]
MFGEQTSFEHCAPSWAVSDTPQQEQTQLMNSLRFVDTTTPTELAFVGEYSLPLVALSVLIASLAAFAGICHLDLMRDTQTKRVRVRWHVSGALALGVGVWTMHFIGMVAFKLPIEVRFDPVWTLISVVPAIAAGFMALNVLKAPTPTSLGIACGGLLMGGGIALMHYVGMSAMMVEAQMYYTPGLFALSISVGVIMAGVALAVPRFVLQKRGIDTSRETPLLPKLISAISMGIAISSLHYVAMAATVFVPEEPERLLTGTATFGEPLILSIVALGCVLILLMSTGVVLLRSRIMASDDRAARSAQKAKQLEDRFEKLVSRLPGMVYQLQVGPDGRICMPYASDAILSVYGMTAEDVKHDAKKLLQVIHPEDVEGLLASIRESAAKLSVWRHEYRVCLNGNELWLDGNAIPDLLPDGTMLWSGFITDISEKKRAEARIHELAFYDDLTGLPNRRLCEDRIEQALANSRRNGMYGGIIFMDLDDFKSLNDTLGHSFGDELLRKLAGILIQNFRETDTVARLGGDEFVIVVNHLGSDEDAAARHAESMAEDLLELLRDPINLNGHQYKCETSVGITLFCGDTESREELLKRADTAMYEAKAAGRSVIRFYDPNTQSILAQRFRLEVELRHALEREEFSLAFQKQVGLKGQCVGVEALLRWNHPVRGEVPPSQFIPIAEDNGLIVEIGDWVLASACRQLALWEGRSQAGKITVSVNVSSRQFHQADFVEKVVRIVDESGIRPAGLCLEITESMVLSDLDDTLRKMMALRAHGIQIAMDDFGTGFSSMAYLSRLPFDEVKIDKSFVQQSGEHASGNAWIIIETIINMAHNLGMRVVAEGIETSQQHEFLTNLGCDRFQGFHLGRPGNVQALEQSLDVALATD